MFEKFCQILSSPFSWSNFGFLSLSFYAWMTTVTALVKIVKNGEVGKIINLKRIKQEKYLSDVKFLSCTLQCPVFIQSGVLRLAMAVNQPWNTKEEKAKFEQPKGGLTLRHNLPNFNSLHMIWCARSLWTQIKFQTHSLSAQVPEKGLHMNGPPVPQNKLLFTIFVSVEAAIPKPYIHDEKRIKGKIRSIWETIFQLCNFFWYTLYIYIIYLKIV